MCIFCRGRGTINGRVEHLEWSSRSNGTSATNGLMSPAYMQGDAIPCPACRPEFYGPITALEITRYALRIPTGDEPAPHGHDAERDADHNKSDDLSHGHLRFCLRRLGT